MRGFKYTVSPGFSAINRTTIEVTLNEEADAEAAADVASYAVTVGDKAVEVEAVAYNEDTNVATLTVADMKNLVGVVAVNGVEGAAVDYTVEAAVIKGEASATEVPVGRDVDVTFVVEDQDGDLMEGAEVRVRRDIQANHFHRYSRARASQARPVSHFKSDLFVY